METAYSFDFQNLDILYNKYVGLLIMHNKQSKPLPKIALIADVPNWAFHNISKQISKHLKTRYNFQIFFYGNYPNIEDLMIEVKAFDLIHFFWRDSLYSFLSKWVQHSFASKKLDYSNFIQNIIATANITTSVSEHLLIEGNEARERTILYNSLAVGYTTFSTKLNKILSSIPNYPPPFGNTEDGVDLEFFHPRNLERLADEDREIVIGWVGNSKWGGDDTDHKGLQTIIKPAIDELRSEGFKVRGEFADRQVKWVPHEEMNDYYNSIDIYVCASDIEGTPNPVLESMACGLPIVSTNVGIVPDAFGKLQKEYILISRTKQELKEKLKSLVENPSYRQSLSNENLREVKKWSWEKQSQKWDAFFSEMLSLSENKFIKEQRNHLRRITLDIYIKTTKTSASIKTENTEKDDASSLEMQIIKKTEILDDLKTKVGLMKESKFWKIRTKWFNLKHKLGMAKGKY